MWLKILILAVVVAVVIYGFRALGGNSARRAKVRKDANPAPPARENAVNLIQCHNCGAYTPEGKSCSSCGKDTAA